MWFLELNHNHKQSHHSNNQKRKEKKRKRNKQRGERRPELLFLYYNLLSLFVLYVVHFSSSSSKWNRFLYWVLFLCCSYSCSERGFLFSCYRSIRIQYSFKICSLSFLFFFFPLAMFLFFLSIVFLSLMPASIIFPSSRRYLLDIFLLNICK